MTHSNSRCARADRGRHGADGAGGMGRGGKGWGCSDAVAALLCALALAGCGGGGDGAGADSSPTSDSTVGTSPTSYRVGGTARGLTGTGLVLMDNGSETLLVSADGAFAFATTVATGATFSVSIAGQPSGEFCSVSNSSGSVGTSDITGIVVTCNAVATGVDPSGSGPDPIADVGGNPSSGDLIEAAVAAGTLTREQGLIYRMYVEYADSRLPAQYKGDDAGIVEGKAHEKVVAYIAEVGLANVAPATLAALSPFFIPAYLVGSYEPASADAGTPASAVAAPLAVAKPRDFHKLGWTSLGGNHVVVWYKTANATADVIHAGMLVTEFDIVIWPRLTKLMDREPKSDLGVGFWGETDGRLDVILDDMPINDEGRTTTLDWSKGSGVAVNITLNRNLSEQGLKANAAHEFMHAIQFSIPVAAAGIPSYATIKEATASWASHYVYPENGWETKYAISYLKATRSSWAYDAPESASEDVNDAFRYGAYVFPLYLDTQYPGIVKDIWDQTVRQAQEMDAIKQAIIARGSTFEDQWKKFIAFCWNQNTINDATRLYAASGVTFAAAPDNPGQDLMQDVSLALTAGLGLAKHGVHLPHAAMAFYRVQFAAADSRSVTFVNGINFGFDTVDPGVGALLQFVGLQPLERQGVSMQVYLKVNGAWQSAPVDVTNVPFLSVCRNNPAGQVDEIIFMYGNAELDRSAPNYPLLQPPGAKPPGLLVTDIGCKDWNVSLDMTRPMSVGSGAETFRLKNVTLTNTSDTSAPQPGKTVPYPLSPGQVSPAPYGFQYAVKSGTAEWAYHQHVAGSSTCDYDGAQSYPITGALPVLMLSNFTPPGRALRGITTQGLAWNGLGAFVFLSTSWRCVGSDGTVTTGVDSSAAVSMDVVVDALMSQVRVASGGLSVSGTAAQTNAYVSGDHTVNGTWSLTAVP